MAEPHERSAGTEHPGGTPVDLPARAFNFYHSRLFLGIVLPAGAANLLVLVLGGLWVYFILLGGCMALLRLPQVNKFLAKKLSTLTGVPARQYLFKPLHGSWWQRLLQLWQPIFWMGIAVVGIWMLLRGGFLAQNILYWVTH